MVSTILLITKWFHCHYRYALLGASGCGKTTVLSSIIGLKKLDEGSLSVFGGVPGETCYGIPGRRVGYMPQVSYMQGCKTRIFLETLQMHVVNMR